MKRYTTLLTGLAALLTALPASGVRARGIPRTVTQPDGTALEIRLAGDENNHFHLTTDNCPVVFVDGTWYFAAIDSRGIPVSTWVPAAPPEARNLRQRHVARPVSADDFSAGRQDGSSRVRRVPQSGMGLSSTKFPSHGDIRGLVILVEYRDVAFSTPDPGRYFDDMLNLDGFDTSGGTGCAAEYFRSNSSGVFRPVFDVYGPVKLENNRVYYGGNDMWGNDRAPEEMVIESVKALDSTVDFSQYDMDGDGTVDNVFVFFAGGGESCDAGDDTVWPHSWTLSGAGKSLTVDGVHVNRYACTHEWEWDEERPAGVGTFIHEFSHVMGLPDLYDTNGILDCTPQDWSVMDYGPYNNGGHTPPNYSAYERNALGWIDLEVLDSPRTVTLPELSSTNQACIINTARETEFFLVENRQQTGWDTYLPGHGMLVWHIDYEPKVFNSNTVNDLRSHQYVQLERANDNFKSVSLKDQAGWPWPGTEGVTAFRDDTSPAMLAWDGTPTGVPLENIDEKNGFVTFDVMGGGPEYPFGGVGAVHPDGRLTVMGRTLVLEGADKMTVHDLSGRCVHSGAAAAEVHAGGVYIVTSGEYRTKVMVR